VNVYRANLSTSDGVAVLWAASKRQAESKARAYAEDCHDDASVLSIRLVRVPDTKPALLAWLNANLSTDNG
jgi:hypothetical protein